MKLPYERPLGSLYSRADVERLAESVRARCRIVPEVGLIIGTGFASFAAEIEEAVRIPFRELPGFPEPGIPGHVGELVIGRLEGRTVACLRGKIALLDGHPAQLVALPVRLFALLGCRSLLYTNTVGAIMPSMRPGEFVAITNHINFYGTNPLIGEPESEWGSRFIDMTSPYDPELIAALKEVAAERGMSLHEGVYFGTIGPSFETAAEIQVAARLGGDVVGMTTIMEVIAARQVQMPVACFGFISNMAAGVEAAPVDNEDILRKAGPAYQGYRTLVRGMLPRMP